MRRPQIATILIAAGVLILPAAPVSASSVTITGTTRAGSTLAVSGGAFFSNQPPVILGLDAAGDTLGSLPDQAGADLAAAQMATGLNGDITFRWVVNELLPVTEGAPTGIVYAWPFCVGESNCNAITSQRVIADPASPQINGGFDLWSCATPECIPFQWTYRQTGAADYDGGSKTITATLPAATIGATDGSTITAVPWSSEGPVYVAYGESMVALNSDPPLDGIQEVDDFTVAERTISLRVGERGLDPESIAYASHLYPAGAGSYSGSVNVGGLSGKYAVYARACFGPNNCGYATKNITL